MRRLNELKRRVEKMRRWWTAETTVYLEPKDRPEDDPHKWYRDREIGEYPEAQTRYWAGTVVEIDEMIKELQELREFCNWQGTITYEAQKEAAKGE